MTSFTLLAVISDSSMIYRPRTAVMWYFRYVFRATSTKFFSLLRGLVTVSYLVVSTPLLSAPSGPVALPASPMHRVAVLVRIMSSQSCGTVWRCLAKVVWSGVGSPAHGILITDRSLSISVFEKPVHKGDNTIMLPGIGTVRVHGDVEGLDMRSFQLVETTKKTTRRAESHNRTYRLHIQVEIKAPNQSESTVIRGVDMGIVYEATAVDLDTGSHTFHDIPNDCRRSKNDDISKMYSELSRKRRGRGNRRIKQDAKEGADGGSKSTNSNNNTSGNNRNKARKPKSRSYKELQRRIQKKREKIANRQTNWERHASKDIADGAGTVAMEDLNLVNMTAGAKGKGSSAKMGLNREMAYSRPGTFQRQIGQACENAGAIVIMVDPKGTSMACHKCGRSDENSRVSQARFRCTNDECDNDINADSNAAHNIAAKAAGRRGSSSKGARLQAGIAPGRSPDKTREPSVGGIARAPVKGRSTVYFCI